MTCDVWSLIVASSTAEHLPRDIVASMIPYDDLVAALSAWRARQGLPVSMLGGGAPQAGSGPTPAPGSGPHGAKPGSGPNRGAPPRRRRARSSRACRRRSRTSTMRSMSTTRRCSRSSTRTRAMTSRWSSTRRNAGDGGARPRSAARRERRPRADMGNGGGARQPRRLVSREAAAELELVGIAVEAAQASGAAVGVVDDATEGSAILLGKRVLVGPIDPCGAVRSLPARRRRRVRVREAARAPSASGFACATPLGRRARRWPRAAGPRGGGRRAVTSPPRTRSTRARASGPREPVVIVGDERGDAVPRRDPARQGHHADRRRRARRARGVARLAARQRRRRRRGRRRPRSRGHRGGRARRASAIGRGA